MRGLTEMEVARLAEAFSGRHKFRDVALFVLGVCCGFRISELLSLTVGDVKAALSDAPEAQIVVKRKFMKKKTQSRAVWVHPDARAALRTYMNACRSAAKDYEPLFLSDFRGTFRPITVRQAQRIFRIAATKAGIHDLSVSTHSMRKTFAREVHAMSGKDLQTTQTALGHRSIQSTIKYLESVNDTVKTIILGRKIL